MALSKVKYDAEFSPKVSRLFVFRFFTMFVEMWVVLVWALWIGLLQFVHFWYMLFLGQRSENIWRRQLRFTRHVAKWNAYLNVLVDQRPKWIED